MSASRNAAAAVVPSGVRSATALLSQAVAGIVPSLAHCLRLLDRHGMVQFARGETSDLAHGYCLDDNVRAFLVAAVVLGLEPDHADALRLGEAALAFAERCRRSDGRFHNFMRADGSFSDEVGSPDSLGRLIWACGTAIACAPSADWRGRAGALLAAALDRIESLTDLRPQAYAVLGLCAQLQAPPKTATDGRARAGARELLAGLCGALARALDRAAGDEWYWFEPHLSWGNARLAEALLRGGVALGDDALRDRGLRALRFLASITHRTGVFVPIGNHGWFPRGGARAIYDQQPIEAATMVDAYLAAAARPAPADQLTGSVEYESKALEAFAWFLGFNTKQMNIVDPNTGGCHDGLGADGLNANMGAESTLSYVHAHAALAAHFRRSP